MKKKIKEKNNNKKNTKNLILENYQYLQDAALVMINFYIQCTKTLNFYVKIWFKAGST